MTDLSHISALNNAVISRDFKDRDWAVKCVTPGIQQREGFRFTSNPLDLTGRWVFAATVDVVGVGVLDNVQLRVMYSDGSASLYSGAAPAVTLIANEWQRISLPWVMASPGKTVSLVELWVRRNSATAQTFWADNAVISTLN